MHLSPHESIHVTGWVNPCEYLEPGGQRSKPPKCADNINIWLAHVCQDRPNHQIYNDECAYNTIHDKSYISGTFIHGKVSWQKFEYNLCFCVIFIILWVKQINRCNISSSALWFCVSHHSFSVKQMQEQECESQCWHWAASLWVPSE